MFHPRLPTIQAYRKPTAFAFVLNEEDACTDIGSLCREFRQMLDHVSPIELWSDFEHLLRDCAIPFREYTSLDIDRILEYGQPWQITQGDDTWNLKFQGMKLILAPQADPEIRNRRRNLIAEIHVEDSDNGMKIREVLAERRGSRVVNCETRWEEALYLRGYDLYDRVFTEGTHRRLGERIVPMHADYLGSGARAVFKIVPLPLGNERLTIYDHNEAAQALGLPRARVITHHRKDIFASVGPFSLCLARAPAASERTTRSVIAKYRQGRDRVIAFTDTRLSLQKRIDKM